ncbi:threonylcarbamoyl-AMP synthase [Patescibacteria group bacterium]|nr:threonylcarbamoyl-AMP synthase [Patescibacteria group bacterium]MBU2036046.1 threonylcarbamoyl-AMP synthase [Patescibacteria group bacterium]
MFNQNLIKSLKKGELSVLPTDTLYGIHTLALNKKSVENVYKLRNRARKKPFIILIGSINQLKLFKIKIDKKTNQIFKKYWPGKVSIILPCPNREFEYLHRGTNSLAFRFPNKKDLTKLLMKTGPLVSTSVNPERMPYAKTIKEAKEYFGEKIKYYFDQGKIDSLPSTVIKIQNGIIKILRQGEVIIE